MTTVALAFEYGIKMVSNPAKGFYGSDSLAFIQWMMNTKKKKASFEMAIQEACKITGLKPEGNEQQYIDNCSEEADQYFQNLREDSSAKRYKYSLVGLI